MSTGFGYMGPYRLLNCVNTGQTSRLWQAYDDRSRNYVAVKTLLDNYRRDREQVMLLKWEYAVGKGLEDDRVIRIREYGKDDGIPYLAMEWFAAPNWKQWINRGIDSYASKVHTILIQAAEAIAYLNSKGWIHRDVKPDNFLIDKEGNVKLIDFALARRVKKGVGKFLARRGKVQGTPSYMSPEQIYGRPCDSRSDVYGLGCTIYECLGGRAPFTGVNVTDLLQKHLWSPAPPVTIANPNVTPDMAKLVQLAMSKKPEARPETSAQFVDLVRGTRPLRKTGEDS